MAVYTSILYSVLLLLMFNRLITYSWGFYLKFAYIKVLFNYIRLYNMKEMSYNKRIVKYFLAASCLRPLIPGLASPFPDISDVPYTDHDD